MKDNQQSRSVSVWEETVEIPTYVPPPPDPNPMFLEKRVNQGASGRVYPNPITDSLSDEKENRTYQAVFLENEYLQVMILPEIGGRVHAALDTTNGYDFIYRQHVIKPALIGLFGSWISGGIEFNWPQHHRPSTFMPVAYVIEEGADGSQTVWLGEHDPMDRTKGMVGICLYPGRAFIETKTLLFNRTPYPQTFLWWHNTAVHTNEQYQVFFPPDVTSVTYHARREVAAFPIANGIYNGIDFGSGTDIGWYKNVPLPTSFFACPSQYDFFGGYDHGRQAGVIHVANHHISPGKKFFTWGNGRVGKDWERHLTDDDGPYLELMAGVYTDNQPDFSWIQPYETKIFSQFWYPIQQIGPAKNANRRGAVNLEIDGRQAKLGVCVTEATPRALISLTAKGQVLAEYQVDLRPGAPFVETVTLPAGIGETDLLLRVAAGPGQELIRYAPQKQADELLAEPAPVPPKPAQVETPEELYLIGLHLEQYRHATWHPEPYWREALRRDPDDARVNNALGQMYLRRSDFARAETHFRSAIRRLTRLNPNPLDGEPYYHLGLSFKFQGRLDEAYASFYKAIWSYAWQGAGYYALAEIDSLRGDFATAIEHLDRSLAANALNLKGRDLKAALLRRQGQLDEAEALLHATIALDPLDFWAHYELVLLNRQGEDKAGAVGRWQELVRLMHGDTQTYLDLAFDYANAGLWAEASELLASLTGDQTEDAVVYPIVLYALGYFAQQLGEQAAALAYWRLAAKMPPDYCFPARSEEYVILQAAKTANPSDGKAFYYLGNLLYDKQRREEAIQNWEIASELDPEFSIVWRNLGLASYNIRRNPQAAKRCYLKAFTVNPNDARLLFELDQLLKRLQTPPNERLARLEEHHELVKQRDDLYLEMVTLYNQTNQPQKALDTFLSRHFHPWEGGGEKLVEQYAFTHFVLGQEALNAGQPEQALEHFEAIQDYPESLGVGTIRPSADLHVHYFIGVAKQALGDQTGARACFQRVAAADIELSAHTYYQAEALKKLGEKAAAQEKAQSLLEYAGRQMNAEAGFDYFGTYVADFVLFEDDLQARNRVDATYLMGLAKLGLGQMDEAKAFFEEVLALDCNHLEAQQALQELSIGG